MDVYHPVMNMLNTRRVGATLTIGHRRSLTLLEDAYAPYGGLASGDQLLRELAARHGTRLGTFARRIVNGELLSVLEHGTHWLPRIQFESGSDAMDRRLVPIVAELAGVFDGWETCEWLVTPNAFTDDRLPLDMLDRDPAAVLAAARADRFIASA